MKVEERQRTRIRRQREKQTVKDEAFHCGVSKTAVLHLDSKPVKDKNSPVPYT